MERKNYLDVAKLLGVLCVMNAHASVTYNPLRRTISAFFMPVFFLIYGMAVSGKPVKSKKEAWQFLEKRIRSLIVPYVLWAFIYAGDMGYDFVKGVLLGTNPSLGMADTNQVLWFLPCMFMAVILFQIYININTAIADAKKRAVFAICMMAVCGVLSSKWNIILPFSFDIALSGCIFMIIGREGGFLFETFWKNVPKYVKIIAAAGLFLLTGVIVSYNLPYLEQLGRHGVTMALAKYGRYDLFLLGALTGSMGLLLTAMVFENVRLFCYMGRFSLMIMAVHFILFPYVDLLLNSILSLPYGELIYPAAVAGACFVICIPLCYIVDWAVPELNGRSIRSGRRDCQI